MARTALVRDSAGGPSGPSASGRRPVVAVVDDDRDMREWLELALRRAGFDVMLATNGLRLVSMLQVDRPDAIVLDVVNSWIDGYELCKALKKNKQFQDIPVVFLSGWKSGDDVRRGLACGGADFFRKPVDSRRLIGRLRELVATPSDPG